MSIIREETLAFGYGDETTCKRVVALSVRDPTLTLPYTVKPLPIRRVPEAGEALGLDTVMLRLIYASISLYA